MIIEINPRSLLNLEHICEVLYKLHPSVLDVLIEIERTLGNIIGKIDLDNTSLEEREFLSQFYQEEDYSSEPMEQDEEGVKVTSKTFDNKDEALKFINEYKSKNPNVKILGGFKDEDEDEDEDEEYKKQLNKIKHKYLDVIDENSKRFHNLRKYIQLNTDEYIPMKISVEVEDPVIGKKYVNWLELLRKLELQNSFI